MAYTRRFVGAGGGGGAGSGTVTNTGNLTANHLVIGNGGVDESVLASLGTTTTVLHGNAAGAPTFAGVSLTADATANQGTTTTLLHGNAAGQPTFSAVDLTADVGATILPPANGGAAKLATASQDYYMLPLGNLASANANTGTATFTANHTRATLIQVFAIVTFTRMSVNIIATANTQKYYIGLYSKDKTTLIRQGIFTLGAGTGVLTVTVSSATLTPGSYWMTWGCDSVTPSIAGVTTPSAPFTALLNGGATPYSGDSDGLIAAGSLPASVGTITGSAAVYPFVLLEP